ncbi:hypothetical protein [Luteimonas suaedae]|uniref:hypothetical protein n=1 Tax=Luteimonas suaedae TaxID=2605430 RepID=UPI0011EEF300|nr:hypothetical protein [Luteimonas suaedae]
MSSDKKRDHEDRKQPAPDEVPRPRDHRGPAHTAVNDPKASKGSELARGGNLSGESNDPSLVHGPTRTRRVPPDTGDDGGKRDD